LLYLYRWIRYLKF